MTSPFAPRTNLADLHERMGRLIAQPGGSIQRPDGGKPWNVRDEHLRGLQIDAVVRPVSPPPPDADPVNCARIAAQWAEDEALFEAARVEHGRGTPAYRAAHRAIVNRPVRVPDPMLFDCDPSERN